ncbi:MAG: hypothetical protein ABSH46_08410 [Bryobacteraceae bacterium]|jgi:hypothetical protein
MCSTFDPKQIIETLQHYQPPNAFLTEVARADKVPNERYFNDNRFNKIQEAWVAGQCALNLESPGHEVAVRLVEEEARFPDFRLLIDGVEHEFEVASRMKPNEKLGQEYKMRAKDKYLLTPYRPALGERRGPCWVAIAVHRKARKHYASRTNLLVYANFEANDLDLARVLQLSGAATQSFSSVWVLWGTRLAKVHDTGIFCQPSLEWL